MEHFGISFCTYDSETTFLPVDLASSYAVQSDVSDLGRIRWWAFRYDLATKVRPLTLRGNDNDDQTCRDDGLDSMSDGNLTRLTLLPRRDNECDDNEDDRDDGGMVATTMSVSEETLRSSERPRPSNRDNEVETFVSEIRSAFEATRTNLEDPVTIANVPTSVRDDAADLHVSIDPYEMMLKHFRVVETSISTAMSEMTLANFFKSFLGTYGCNVTKGALKDTVNRMRSRLKTDYPHIFDKNENSYHVLFVPR